MSLYRTVDTEPGEVVRICRQHRLACSEEGDRVICPAGGGHELVAPLPRTGPGSEDSYSTRDLPWFVRTVRGARLASGDHARQNGAAPGALAHERRPMATAPPPGAKKYSHTVAKVVERQTFQDGAGRRLFIKLERHPTRGWWRVYAKWGTNPGRSETTDDAGVLHLVGADEPDAERQARAAYQEALRGAAREGWQPFEGGGRGGCFKMVAIPPAQRRGAGRKK